MPLVGWQDKQCYLLQEESVKLLLKWGADLDIKDHAGMHPVKMAQMHPRILALLHQHQV